MHVPGRDNPTPTKPELAEIDNAVFPRLERGAGRSLRVFFISTERAKGILGAEGVWNATTSYAAPLDVGLVGDGITLSTSPWVTIFDDKQTPRPGTDEVFFSPSNDGTEILPPPIAVTDPRVIAIPVEAIPLATVAIAGAGFLARRRMRAP